MTGYFGSKAGAGTAERIISLMPPHETYIEPFLGSGVIMNAKPPARVSIGFDLDPCSIAKYNYPEGADIREGDGLAYLAFLPPSNKALVYCDPPYHPDTRTSRHKYRFDWTVADHERFLGIVKGLRCSVIISGYDCPLYARELSAWHKIDYQAMTRGGVRTESLWLNYEPGDVHWHTHAGKNRTQRQQIKRKAARWAKNYAACSPGERLAIMNALITADEVTSDCT